MDYWNFAEVMQYIAYGGFVFVNLSALIRWGIRRVKFLQRDVVGEDGKLYDFFLLRNYVSVNFISPLDRKIWWFVFGTLSLQHRLFLGIYFYASGICFGSDDSRRGGVLLDADADVSCAVNQRYHLRFVLYCSDCQTGIFVS